MSKVIEYGDDARQHIINGVDAVANIVKTTVGPKGRNVLIRELTSPPVITNDGVTIAKSIELKDKIEDAGAQLIIQAANKTNEVAGDGTTSTTILAQEMIHQYYEKYSTQNDINVVQIQKQMLSCANEISNYLKISAKEVTDNESIKRVATISSGNEVIGSLIADAFKLAGKYGSVIVEDSKTGMDTLTNIEGMKLTNGSVSQFLLNDRVNRKSEMVDVSVLVSLDKIDSIPDVFKVLDTIVKTGRKLLIICNDIEMEPLNMILMNKAQGRLSNIGIITLPAFGELREKLVEDICLATGAKIIGRDQGTTLRDFDESYLGEVEQVTITMDDTVLKFKDICSNGTNLKQCREERVAELEATMQNVPENDKEQYKRRISNLVSGISSIQVGGNSEVEVKDKKLRVEDAINSVQSAIEEGIVPGGGYSFLDYYMNVAKNQEEPIQIGKKIVWESLKSITKQIAENSGLDGEDVVNKCIKQELGYNALTGQYEDLLKTGVINSVKVDRYSLLNATSIASTVITMGGVITDENEKDQNILQLQASALPPMM